MLWHYLPICIRFVPKQQTEHSQAVSGIYVVKKIDGTIVDSFCLTVCHIPTDQLESDHKIYVSAPQLNRESIFWRNATTTASVSVFRPPSDPLYNYIRNALNLGFNIFPLDSSSPSALQNISVLQLRCSSFYTESSASLFSPLRFGAVESPAAAVVRSTPFSFTSPTMFADFSSSGHINCVLKDSSTCYGYLSDIKYLENMCGAIANSNTGKSLGLVLGNLRKLNGDGDLLVICLWLWLWEQLMYTKKPESAVVQKHAVNQLRILNNSPVLPIVLSLQDLGTSWGSCVLFNERTLVTNQHVVASFSLSKEILASILLNAEKSIALGPDDQIIFPSEGLDLAFILLSPSHQMELAYILPANLGLSDHLKQGNVVRTAGYGLLLNENGLTPLISEGHISSKVSLRPFLQSEPIPCMIIASARCWNGSSGGGLFNSKKELVGIICSNAQVYVPSIHGNQLPKTEKVPLFALCIPIELVIECYQRKVLGRDHSVLLKEVEQIWKLDVPHKDIFERNAKL